MTPARSDRENNLSEIHPKAYAFLDDRLREPRAVCPLDKYDIDARPAAAAEEMRNHAPVAVSGGFKLGVMERRRSLATLVSRNRPRLKPDTDPACVSSCEAQPSLSDGSRPADHGQARPPSRANPLAAVSIEQLDGSVR